MEMTHESTSLSEAVVTAVADHAGVPHDELDKPLYDAVDPDALDALFRNSPGEVTLRFNGYWVTVDDEGSVTVSDERDGPDSRPLGPAVEHARTPTSTS